MKDPVNKLDVSRIALNDDVDTESTLDDCVVILWLRGARQGQHQLWQRIANVPEQETETRQDVNSMAATYRPMRQKMLGAFGRWQRKLLGTTDGSWLTPAGDAAEPTGPRKSNAMIVWSNVASNAIDESLIRQLWDDTEECMQLGKNLFFVTVTEQQQDDKLESRPQTTPAAAEADANPINVASHQLARARGTGDRRDEATSLTDLGILYLRGGQTQQAIEHLERAVATSRMIQDQAGENDALGELGLAMLAKDDPRAARAAFEQVLAAARESGNRFAEKTALANLGMTWSYLGDPAVGLDFNQQSLAISREVGDRERQAETLWAISVQQAELGMRDHALASAEEAVDVYGKLGDPKAEWFASHLKGYRRGETDLTLEVAEADPVAASQSPFGGSIDVNFVGRAMPGQTPPGGSPTGPSLLRMAISAGTAMAKFIGSGMKTVSTDTHQHRIQMCEPCEHHTGVRCRLCACFTNQKAWLPHEHCPIGKWPND